MLERIEIENLGSIRKTALSLGPLTVLLGANASGKTTVMRGIELFAALRSKPLRDVTFAGHAFTYAEWPLLIHGGDQTRRLSIRSWVDADSTEPDYEMQIGPNWARWTATITEHAVEPAVELEFLFERMLDPSGSWIEARASAHDATDVGEYLIRTLPVKYRGPRSESIANRIAHFKEFPPHQDQMADLIHFAELFGTAQYFRPNGAAMLTAGSGGRVGLSGEGFIAALAVLQNRESERFEAIERQLSQLFPHIRRIRFDIGTKGTIQRLVFETHRSNQRIPAELEADGVLTTLFLLWAGATTPHHGTLLIDEPEAALHPHLMGKRVEFLRSLAMGEFTGYPLRVVVATQSVDFVRWLDTSEIRVVEYSPETGTRVHAIPESETLRTLVDKFQANTGDLWYSGALGGVPGTGA
jgi:hypothetical protein